MFGRSSYEIAEIERRMQLLERRLDRLRNSASRTAVQGFDRAVQATDRVSDAVIAALGDVIDRFRGSTRGISSEAARFGQDASRLGGEALRRVSSEIERRPLMMVAIAAGIGILIGLSGRRH
jgi:ElaB/YqjD/DUF883 family membrane-anchored ribosome-binding protein